MRITHLNTNDDVGGAAISARRIVESQILLGHSSMMTVLNKHQNKDYIFSNYGLLKRFSSKIYFRFDQFNINRYKEKESILFTPGIFSGNPFSEDLLNNNDIINLHWLSLGYASIKSFSKLKGKTIFWTMHDSWAFTGGCHVSYGCDRYTQDCGACIILHSNRQKDISNRCLNKKLNTFRDINFVIISPSKWMQKRVSESKIFNSSTSINIPNPINTDIFKPLNLKSSIKYALNLNENKITLGFGAVNSTSIPYKGFNILKDAFNLIVKKCPSLKSKIQLVVFGAYYSTDISNFPFEVKFLGDIRDEILLPFVYNSFDIFITPSLEDNYPNTVLESLACGVPVVAFPTGGIPEMVKTDTNGIIASKYNDPDSFANAIIRCLDALDNFTSHKIAETVKSNSYQNIGEKYLELYEKFKK